MILRTAAVAAMALSMPALAQTGAASGATGEPLRPSDPIRLTITSPAEGQVVAGPKVDFTFDLHNYALAAKGNHVHLIVDGKPYVAVYDASKPFTYPDPLAEGVHTAIAFPSRPWHEGWKDPQSIAVSTFYVGQKQGRRPISYTEPMVFFSRPKGTYENEQANRILFDFALWNVDLSPGGYKVVLGIDGKTWTLDQWRPYWVTGLKNGSHTFTLHMVAPNGRMMLTPYAPFIRTIEVKGGTGDGNITLTPITPGPEGNGGTAPGMAMPGMAH